MKCIQNKGPLNDKHNWLQQDVKCIQNKDPLNDKHSMTLTRWPPKPYKLRLARELLLCNDETKKYNPPKGVYGG